MLLIFKRERCKAILILFLSFFHYFLSLLSLCVSFTAFYEDGADFNIFYSISVFVSLFSFLFYICFAKFIGLRNSFYYLIKFIERIFLLSLKKKRKHYEKMFNYHIDDESKPVFFLIQ